MHNLTINPVPAADSATAEPVVSAVESAAAQPVRTFEYYQDKLKAFDTRLDWIRDVIRRKIPDIDPNHPDAQQKIQKLMRRGFGREIKPKNPKKWLRYIDDINKDFSSFEAEFAANPCTYAFAEQEKSLTNLNNEFKLRLTTMTVLLRCDIDEMQAKSRFEKELAITVKICFGEGRVYIKSANIDTIFLCSVFGRVENALKDLAPGITYVDTSNWSQDFSNFQLAFSFDYTDEASALVIKNRVEGTIAPLLIALREEMQKLKKVPEKLMEDSDTDEDDEPPAPDQKLTALKI